VLAMTALGVGLEVLRPWPMKLLVDHVLGSAPVPGVLADLGTRLPGPGGPGAPLLAGTAGTLLLFGASTVVTMVQSSASVRLGQRVVYELGADLFLHLQRLSLPFHSRRPAGDSIARG